MRGEGVKDFSQYLGSREGREEDLMPDFFLDDFLEMEQKNLGIKSIHKGRYGGGSGVVVQALNVKGTNTPPPPFPNTHTGGFDECCTPSREFNECGGSGWGKGE